MDKENKNSNVPNLRFPDYNDSLKNICLSELLSFQNGINADSDKYGKGIKYISVGDIINNDYITYDCIKGKVDISQKELNNYLVENGDILFQRSSETFEDIGNANVYLDEQPCTFGGFVIRGKRIGEYDPKYLNYLLKSPNARKQVIRLGAGAQHYNINQESLNKIILSFPSAKEQEKISRFLTKIEEQIQLQNKIIEVKRLLKDLIIDNCIFKSNDCEYVEVYNFADLKNGYAFKSNNYTDCGKYKVITIGNVSGERYLNLNKLNYLTYIPLDIQKHQILKKGDLLISLTGNVGRISICNEENCLLNQRVGLIELFNVNDYEYLYQVMASKRFQNDMVLRAQGAAQPNIGKDDVLNYRIPYLNNLNKRKKISSVLRLLDNSILSDENLLITYNKQKQYLLRNLFI